jgi:uncharacterized protein (TIGR01777 family)
MHILMTGGTGFIGATLAESLVAAGHSVTVLTRQDRVAGDGVNFLRSLDEIPDASAIDGMVNLAGASLAGRRWTTAYKREIVESRLDTTRALLQLVERLDRKPEVLVSASAVGYYGHHGDEALGEDAASTPGFSSDLCHRWEALALQAAPLGVRVCLARLGVVLGRGGGALEQMARPFRFGIANWLGDGRQWLSWVHRRDVIAALSMLLERVDLSGPFNVTAPEPVTSRGFCDAMKRRKKTVVTAPVPAALMRLMVGEMADELLLHGQRVVPVRLQSAGFEFEYPDLDGALQDII